MRSHSGSQAAWYVEEPGISSLLFFMWKEKESLSDANDPLCCQSHGSKYDLSSHPHLCMWLFLLVHTTHTHTFFNSVDFHNSFWFSVILENQLDGIFYADASSDESYQVFVVHLFTQKTRALWGGWGRKERWSRFTLRHADEFKPCAKCCRRQKNLLCDFMLKHRSAQ